MPLIHISALKTFPQTSESKTLINTFSVNEVEEVVEIRQPAQSSSEKPKKQSKVQKQVKKGLGGCKLM